MASNFLGLQTRLHVTKVRAGAVLLVFLGLALLTANVYADDQGKTFVYVNNNNPNTGPNTVSAFSVMSGGTLSMVPGSPFATGGTGSGNGFYGSPKITTATVGRNFLYVSNIASNNISVFKIDTDTGALTPVSGSPFATGTVAGFAISLATTPNGRFLYAGISGPNTISVFSIAANGALSSIGSPVPVGDNLDGFKVSPDGKFLGAALPDFNSVAMFKIASNGTLMAVPGSPFSAAGGPGSGAAGVEISCKSNLLFNAQYGGATTVAVFTIAPAGTLAQIAGSPFTFAPGRNSNVGVLTPDGQHLDVSNQASNTITVLDVASGGSLTQEADSPSGPSPFANPGGSFPQSEGTNREGDLLYVSNGDPNGSNPVVTGFHIDSDGGLSPVAGSPFATGGTGFEPSLSVFPAHKHEGEGDEMDDSGHKGHFEYEADSGCEDSGEMHYSDDSSNRGSVAFNRNTAVMSGLGILPLPSASPVQMDGKVSAVAVNGNTAVISGPGTLADGTPVTYTAVVIGNQLITGANVFAISWITATGSIFQTSGALIDGYIAVHQ